MTLIENINIDINRIKVLRWLKKAGMSDDENIYSSITKKPIADYINDIRQVINPAGSYLVCSIRQIEENSGITILIDDNGIEHPIKSSFIAKKFKGNNKGALFLATIGNYLPLLKDKGSGYERLDKIIYDAIGSVAAEETAQRLNRIVADEHNMKRIIRFSPGVNPKNKEFELNDWKLTDYHIFECLNPAALGICFDPVSGFMTPEKSVSGIIKLY